MTEGYARAAPAKDAQAVAEPPRAAPAGPAPGAASGNCPRPTLEELAQQNEILARIEGELIGALQHYRALFDLAPLGQLTLNGEGLIVESNLAAAESLGLPRSRLGGQQHLARFIAPESRAEWLLCHCAVFAAEGKRACELALQRADGSPFLGRLELALLNHDPSRPPQALLTLADLDVRPAPGRAPRARPRPAAGPIDRQQLSQGLDRLPIFALFLDRERRVLFANRHLRGRFGDPAGRRCHEYLFGLEQLCAHCQPDDCQPNDFPQPVQWSDPGGRLYNLHCFSLPQAGGENLILALGREAHDGKPAAPAAGAPRAPDGPRGQAT